MLTIIKIIIFLTQTSAQASCVRLVFPAHRQAAQAPRAGQTKCQVGAA